MKRRLKEFVKSLNPKVESVQIDWDETMGKKSWKWNSTRRRNVVIVGGGFNNIEGSTWQGNFEIEDGRVAFDTMMQGGPFYEWEGRILINSNLKPLIIFTQIYHHSFPTDFEYLLKVFFFTFMI